MERVNFNVPESLKNCLIKTYQSAPVLTKQLETLSKLSDSEVMNKNIDSISESTKRYSKVGLWLIDSTKINLTSLFLINLFLCLVF